MDLIFIGDSYQAVGEKLNISVSTVKTHISNIFRKTGASNKVELIALCIKRVPELFRFSPESPQRLYL